ncbi:MAG: hypothetical protein ACEPOZ_14565 [Marinifilaceae bacterium]
MKTADIIKVDFTQEQKDVLGQNYKNINDIVNPNTESLSNADRRNLGSVAEQNKLFINKVEGYMNQFPEFIPASVDTEEFKRDKESREFVEHLIQDTEILLRKLTDTKILLDHDNYQASLAYYRTVRFNAQENIENAVPIYNDLKKFFTRKNGKKEEED